MTEISAPIDNRVSRCALCKIDLKGRFVYVDAEAESFFGLCLVELFGRQFIDFLIPDDEDVIERIASHHNRYETFFDSTRVTFVTGQGMKVSATVVISLNFDAGNPVNHQIIINPMVTTDTVGDAVPTVDETQTLLNTSPLVDLLDRIEVGALLYGANGEMIDCNQTCGRLLHPISPGESFDDLMQYLSRSRNSNIAESARVYLETSCHHIELPVFKSPILLPSGHHVQLTISPLTPGCDDRSAFVIFMPLSATPGGYSQAAVSSEYLHSAMSGLHSSAAASDEITQRLVHSLPDQSKGDDRFTLDCQSRHLLRLQSILAELTLVSRMTQLKEKPQSVKLGRLVDKQLKRLKAAHRNLSISASYASLPSIVTELKPVRAIISSIMYNGFVTSGVKRPKLEISTTDKDGCCQLSFNFHDTDGNHSQFRNLMSTKGSALSQSDSKAADEYRLSPGAIRELIRCIGGDVNIVSSASQGTSVTLSLPTRNP